MIFKILYKLLPPDQRKKALIILLVRILNSLLDFIGIALLIIILIFVIKKQLNGISLYFIVLAGGLVLLIKNIITILVGRKQTGWLLSLYRYYSLRLLETGYSAGLTAIRSKGTATITHEVNSICYAYSMNVVGSAILLIGQVVLLFLFVSTFFVYSPWAASIFVGGLFPAAAMYCYFIRTKIAEYGKEEMEAKRKQWVLVENIFRGYVEMETHLAFPYFRERFMREMDKISSCRKSVDTYTRFSSVYMETGMILVLLLLTLTAENGQDMIVLLGIYSIAGMRIVPIIRTMINCWAQIQNNRYIVDIVNERIHEEISALPVEKRDTKIGFQQEIQIKNISFSYNDAVKILDGFSMHLKCGEKVGIQGASGIGKTTLLNLLLGCISPQQGEILIDGIPLQDIDLPAWYRQIGYVSQDIFILDASIRENIAFGVPVQDIDVELVFQVLKQVQLDNWIDQLPGRILTPLGENGCRISGGQKQRIGIARALYKGCRILLLDEVTSNLDNATEKEILSMLVALSGKQKNMSLLIISHRDQTLSICDRILQMQQPGKNERNQIL